MYHHRSWSSSMCNSIRRRIMSHSNTKGLFGGGYGLPIHHPVCTTNRWSSWFSSSSSSSSSFTLSTTPPTPYLFLSPTSKGKILPVFNPSDRCFYDFPIPKELQGPDCSVRGSGHGWLLMIQSNVDDDEEDEEEESNRKSQEVESMILSLYNPMTRTNIPLPSLAPDFLGYGLVWCNPAKASRGQPLVSIRYGFSRRHIVIYHQGDDHWSMITSPPDHIIGSTVYHEAEATLYVGFCDYRLSVLDLDTWTLRPVIDTPSPKIKSLGPVSCLLVGPAGELLLFVMNRGEFKALFKLDRRLRKWVRTREGVGVGDHTFFMADSGHVASMVCDPGFTDARPNQIYYFNQYRARCIPENRIEVPAYVDIWDLTSNNGNQKVKLLFETSKILVGKPCYLPFATWIVPSLE